MRQEEIKREEFKKFTTRDKYKKICKIMKEEVATVSGEKCIKKTGR